MVFKKRKHSFFSRPDKTPRRIDSVMIGTHVQRRSHHARYDDPIKRGSFSNPKKNARVQRGEIDHVIPSTASRESSSDYAKRVNRPSRVHVVQKQRRRRNFLIGGALIASILLIAGGVGVFTYMGSVSAKMSLTDSNAKTALVAAKEQQPFYVLVLGEFSESGKEYEGPDLIMLLRVDESQKKLTLISIPSNLQVMLSDGKYRKISEAQLLGGDAALVKAVAQFSGVSIAHLIKTDQQGFTHIVDCFDGVSVEVSEEVDDPAAGSYYIPQGVQTLKGEQALTFCRATNFRTGEEMRIENGQKMMRALLVDLLKKEGIALVFTLDGIAESFKTDYQVGDLLSLGKVFQGVSEEDISFAQVPGSVRTDSSTGVSYFVVSDADWETLRLAVEAGEKAPEKKAQFTAVKPDSFTLIVRNGSGVTGGAQQIADHLTEAGFQIKETGNADRYVYNETLVIYADDKNLSAAETVVSNLGMGRTVASNGFYSFDSDVLVVVGKDWKPLQ